VLKIVSVGRLIEFKGFRHLIAACAELDRRGVRNELTIVGDGPLEEQLRAQAGSGVNFVGVQSGEAIRSLLADSHVFALASVVDSKGASDILPTVIAEAMAAALPVVSTRLVGIPEMVEHGQTGLLCQPGDEAALADALATMAAEPQTRARLGAAGRELARERFGIDVTARQLLDLFPDTAKSAPRYPALVYLAASWGARDQRSADPELAAAAAHLEALPLALHLHDDFRSTSPAPPAGLQFAPDPIVLAAAWDAAPERAEKVASLTNDQNNARLAVYLAEFLHRLGARHLHAARSDVTELAWLIAQLIDIDVTCCIEEGATNPRQITELEGLDLSIRQTRHRLGPLRIRIKPTPVTPEAAQNFIAKILTEHLKLNT